MAPTLAQLQIAKSCPIFILTNYVFLKITFPPFSLGVICNIAHFALKAINSCLRRISNAKFVERIFKNFCIVSVIQKTIITWDDKSRWLDTFYWVVKNERNFCRAGFAFGKTKWSSITQEIGKKDFFRTFIPYSFLAFSTMTFFPCFSLFFPLIYHLFQFIVCIAHFLSVLLFFL